MRLTIKNTPHANGEEKTNGANGANGTSPGKATSLLAAPYSRVLLRTLQSTAGEVGEALLQLLSGATPFVPRMRVRESDDAIIVSALLPDLDEGSLEVAFEEHGLRIRGEKTESRQKVRRRYRRDEKVCRTFERVIPIYGEVDRDKAVATLSREALRIHVPKVETPRGPVKPVAVSAGSVATSSPA